MYGLFGGISIKKYNIMTIFIIIISAIFLAGCVDKEQTQVVTPPLNSTQVATSTPTLSPTPTITIVTSIPTPLPTSVPVNLTIPIKAGYKLYQNNEYSYGFGYPNDWTMGDFITTDNQLQGVGLSSDKSGGGIVTVTVHSSDPKLLDKMGGFDNLIKSGYVTTKNITINGREAFEIISSEKFMPLRWVTIQANGYYYVMTVSSTAPYNDIINSWIIGDIKKE